MKKKSSVFLIAILIGGLVFISISHFGIVRAEFSSITKPSVPEFTVRLVDYSYDVPATQSVDPYTGETVTHPAYRVENRSIEVRIKNQPFTPFQIQENGNNWTVNFFYNIRVKGHFGQDWTEVFHPSDGFPIRSDSECTVISFYSTGGEDFYATSTNVVHAPSGGQVDFQVEAMIGYVHRPNISIAVPGSGWVFTGETSGWSETKTIAIDSNSFVPTSFSDSQNPTASSEQSDLNWTEVALFTALGVIVALVIVVIVLVRRRRGSQNANLSLPKSNQ